LFNKYLHNKQSKKIILRNNLQQLYVHEIITNLNLYNRVFMSALTGFGKTHIFFRRSINYL
jgi:hypothetical protein